MMINYVENLFINVSIGYVLYFVKYLLHFVPRLSISYYIF